MSNKYIYNHYSREQRHTELNYHKKLLEILFRIQQGAMMPKLNA